MLLEAPAPTGRAALADLAAVLGPDRRTVLCRELTKTHEEIVRGGLGELAAWADEREMLGEFALGGRGSAGGAGQIPSAERSSAKPWTR